MTTQRQTKNSVAADGDADSAAAVVGSRYVNTRPPKRQGATTTIATKDQSQKKNTNRSSTNNVGTTRMGTTTAATAAASARNNVLENDMLLQTILSFLPYTYRYTAAVDRRFRRNYEARFPHPLQHHRTSLEYAVAGIGTARICRAECSGTDRRPRRSGGEKCSPPLLIGTKAAEGGHVHVLEWLRQHGYKFRFHTMLPYHPLVVAAVRRGHLHVLAWVQRHGGTIPRSGTLICDEAARNGHLDVLKWARIVNGCPWDERTCEYAAGSGHLDVLRWARANGCPWDVWSCAKAAQGGHLDVLMWLRANGCPWSAGLCTQYAQNDVIRSWITLYPYWLSKQQKKKKKKKTRIEGSDR